MIDNAPTLHTVAANAARDPFEVAIADGWLALYDPTHSTCQEGEQRLCESVPDRLGNLPSLVFAVPCEDDDPVEIEDDDDGWPG